MALAIATSATGLCAQEAPSWSYSISATGREGEASICDEVDSQTVCLAVLCGEDDLVGLAIQTSEPNTGFETRLTIDDGPERELVFGVPATYGGPSMLPWKSERDVQLLSEIKRGHKALLQFDMGEHNSWKFDFSLLGSNWAISSLQRRCPRLTR